MLSKRLSKLLALMAGIAILATTSAAQRTEKRRKRIIMLGGDNQYLLFVAGQPLLVAARPRSPRASAIFAASKRIPVRRRRGRGEPRPVDNRTGHSILRTE